MNVTQAFRMAFKSISSKKLRSFLTMLGIIIGIAAVMTIVSVVSGSNKKSMEYFQAMGANRITASGYLYDGGDAFSEIYDYCKGLDLVVGVTPSGYVGGTIKYGTKVSDAFENPPEIYLGSDQYSLCNNFHIASGRDISRLDVEKYNPVCVLGARAAQLLFDASDPLNKVITISGASFTVVGVYAAKDADRQYSLDNVVVIPYTARRDLTGVYADLGQIIVKVKDAPSINKVISLLQSRFASWNETNRGYFWCYSEQQWQDESNQYASMMSLVLGAIAGISLLVGGIGIMNIMLVTVTERTREIGIRRAIGAQRSSIVLQFLIEAAMICAIGGVFGIALGFLGTAIASKLIVKEVMLPSTIISAGAFLFSVILGILFGLFPAIKASKMQPVIALRAE